MKNLTTIQKELRAPKNRKNSFGNYNYRNCEDILEAVKPKLVEYGSELTLSDDVIEVGGQLFVRATAKYSEGDECLAVSALAGIEMNRKSMDFSQSTGTASSYARKYCLNGLFLIDDTKDADTDEHKIEILVKEAIEEIGKADNELQLAVIFGKYQMIQENQRFLTELRIRKKQLKERASKNDAE